MKDKDVYLLVCITSLIGLFVIYHVFINSSYVVQTNKTMVMLYVGEIMVLSIFFGKVSVRYTMLVDEEKKMKEELRL